MMPLDPPPDFSQQCPRCGEPSEGVCAGCADELNAFAKEADAAERIWVAAYDFAAACDHVRGRLDRGADLYDLDLEVIEVWTFGHALNKIAAVEPLDEDDAPHVAALVASQVLRERVDVPWD